MSFSANSEVGEYQNLHRHNTPLGWDSSKWYMASPDGKDPSNLTNTSIVANGYSVTFSSYARVTSSRVQLTDEKIISNIQPSIVVYYWRRTT